jgi:hypothetical protein
MTRGRAATIHIFISGAIALIAVTLFLGVWYPPPFFHAAGADELTLLLVGVDVCAGPLLTLIVFRPGKRGLKLDLAVIALIQVFAFFYGSYVVLQSRPIFLVGDVDRFVLISANQITDADLAQGSQARFRVRSWTGPVLVMAEMPTDDKERTDIAFSALGGRDLQNLPRYYHEFMPLGAQLLERSKPLESLLTKPGAQDVLKYLPEGKAASDIRWLPLQARKTDLVMLMDATTAMPIKALAIDPW